mmetsp:Transcript_98911/g.159458  ORF Transcript_98911/g.159458 Transcript_98911/m.159458 type:complete len:205 (-) Transcript_98911:496-1110(-)
MTPSPWYINPMRTVKTRLGQAWLSRCITIAFIDRTMCLPSSSPPVSSRPSTSHPFLRAARRGCSRVPSSSSSNKRMVPRVSARATGSTCAKSSIKQCSEACTTRPEARQELELLASMCCLIRLPSAHKSWLADSVKAARCCCWCVCMWMIPHNRVRASARCVAPQSLSINSSTIAGRPKSSSCSTTVCSTSSPPTSPSMSRAST